jgi:hypothetical protein
MRLGIDEVQEVTATESTFTLTYEQQTTGALNSTASAAEVEAALDALSSVGVGNTHVEAVSSGVYRVTFAGMLANRKTAELSATGATTSVQTKGAASGTVVVDLFNDGAEASSGPITITDTLPSGFEAKQAGALRALTDSSTALDYGIDPVFEPEVWNCHGKEGNEPIDGAKVVTCENDAAFFPQLKGGGGLPTLGELAGFHNPDPVLGITVSAESASERGENKVVVAGGGSTTPATYTSNVVASTAPPTQGITESDAWFTNADGTTDIQAGSHPYASTFVYAPAIGMQANREAYVVGGEARNLESRLPPGLVGDLSKVEQCTRQQLQHELCPPDSMVGVLGAQPMLPIAGLGGPIFNMRPEQNSPAELGFVYGGVTAFFTFSVRSGDNYGLTAHLNNLPPAAVAAAMITLWGVPAEKSHDFWRSYEGGCSQEQIEHPQFGHKVEGPELWCAEPQGELEKPILTLPTACEGPQTVSLREVGTWADPQARSEASVETHEADGTARGFVGCEQMRFEPFTALDAGTRAADTSGDPFGEISTSLAALEDPTALSTETVKSLVVTLPQGFALNPERATGLEFCGAAESKQTTAAEAALGEENNEPAACRAGSKLASVEIETPLLEGAPEPKVTGALYLLESNPPEVKVLLAAGADGVNLKLPGTVALDQGTGAITATFADAPPIPFSHVRLKFGGGYAGSLVTPARCGVYESLTSFETWGNPNGRTQRQALLPVDSGPGGSGCAEGHLPFAPSLAAGSTSGRAGGFTSFTTLLERGDGQQRPERLQIKAPLGLAGLISSVPLCPEPAAQQGTCPASSQIGHATVKAGPGANPLVIPQPGEPVPAIYLTGPYHGAPFGLSIVTRALAGPFDLGTIVTRAKIEVDPTSAQVTITTDPLPSIIKGVPTDLRSISAVIDRPNFIFNPTNCNPLALTGTIQSDEGASFPVTVPFQTTNCATLKFTPKFSANTAGAAHPNGPGASFHVRLLAHEGPTGSGQASGEANIKRVEVQLPKLLPARLTTLQKSCTQAQFSANPAGCPEFSFVGTATAHTPVLANALTGPAILVSHGGAAFPDLVIVLQGEGITLDLVGNTQITKGITYSRFETIPDAPVSSFELDLPQSKHSALSSTSFSGLCGQNLVMPTFMEAQNGAQLHQNTQIEITGCGPKIAITKKKLTGNSITVTVKTTVKGVVTITGPGLRKTTKTLGAGSHTIKVPLTANGRTARNKHHKIKIKAALKAGKKTVSKTAGLKL